MMVSLKGCVSVSVVNLAEGGLAPSNSQISCLSHTTWVWPCSTATIRAICNCAMGCQCCGFLSCQSNYSVAPPNLPTSQTCHLCSGFLQLSQGSVKVVTFYQNLSVGIVISIVDMHCKFRHNYHLIALVCLTCTYIYIYIYEKRQTLQPSNPVSKPNSRF